MENAALVGEESCVVDVKSPRELSLNSADYFFRSCSKSI